MNRYRADFPILNTAVNGKPLIYLDNAATSHKPKPVIDALVDFYTTTNANIHRGIHTLSVKATDACEHARRAVAQLIGADPDELVFTYGTTSSINHVVYAWAERELAEGDEIILSVMEHHANTVPWLELKKRKNITLSFVPMTESFELDYAALERMISNKTKLISLLHVSNVLGTENDVPRIVSSAKKVGARVMIDAAQSIARVPIDVHQWGIDFMAFSGHKMYGPTGIGGLFIKKDVAKSIQPFISGGGMILEVTHDHVTYQEPPHGLEAGTPHIAGIVGLGVAAEYLMQNGVVTIGSIERTVTEYAYVELQKIPDLTLHCHRNTHGVLSFTIKGIHPHDIAEIANRRGVAIRSGNHCAMPLHTHLGIPASARASIACYNTTEDIDALIEALGDAKRIFQ